MVRRAMAAAMYKNLGRNVYDFLNLKGASKEKLASMVGDVRGMENLEEILHLVVGTALEKQFEVVGFHVFSYFVHG